MLFFTRLRSTWGVEVNCIAARLTKAINGLRTLGPEAEVVGVLACCLIALPQASHLGVLGGRLIVLPQRISPN